MLREVGQDHTELIICLQKAELEPGQSDSKAMSFQYCQDASARFAGYETSVLKLRDPSARRWIAREFSNWRSGMKHNWANRLRPTYLNLFLFLWALIHTLLGRSHWYMKNTLKEGLWELPSTTTKINKFLLSVIGFF